jgi:hypothetical protein
MADLNLTMQVKLLPTPDQANSVLATRAVLIGVTARTGTNSSASVAGMLAPPIPQRL